MKNNTELTYEFMRLNIRRMKIMVYIIFGFLLWTVILNTVGRIIIYPTIIPFFKGYLILYFILFIGNLLGWYWIFYKKWTVSYENLHKSIQLFVGYNFFMLLSVTAISIADAIRLGHVAIFELYFFLIMVIFYFPFRFAVILPAIFAPNIIISLLLSPVIDVDHAYILCGNVLIFTNLSLVTSRFLYKKQRDLIHQRRELLEKNKQNEWLMEQLHESNKELSELMQRDPLTGVYNRRAFDSYMSQKLKQPTNYPLTFIMIDIDYFKQYNDHYGHIEGDDVLIKVAKILQKIANERQDFVMRWGGEEFMYVATETDEEQLVTTIQQRIRAAAIPHEKSEAAPYITVSMGVFTTMLGVHAQLSDYYKMSDNALYLSKQNGRNQFTILK